MLNASAPNGGRAMKAKDLMTTDVITVGPDATVRHVAQLLLRHRISAVPVVDGDGKLVGIVSEGDLMRRAEVGTEPHRSWWLDLLARPESIALDYVRSHARLVGDVMTRRVITVDEDEPVSRIATVLEEKRIKRVPVCKDGRLVGIVSRADLLHGIATARLERTKESDEEIRRTVVARMRAEAGVRDWLLNVTVSEGTVHFWGGVRSEAERRAARIAAETVGGVKAVEDHLTLVPEVIGG
jgi:CBS-domain-containing membrane protein